MKPNCVGPSLQGRRNGKYARLFSFIPYNDEEKKKKAPYKARQKSPSFLKIIFT